MTLLQVIENQIRTAICDSLKHLVLILSHDVSLNR
jgi:hypothetical protein